MDTVSETHRAQGLIVAVLIAAARAAAGQASPSGAVDFDKGTGTVPAAVVQALADRPGDDVAGAPPVNVAPVAAAAGAPNMGQSPSAGPPGAAGPAARAIGRGGYPLSTDQLVGIRSLVDYLDRRTQYRDITRGDHEFSVRTPDDGLIFMYRTVRPHLIGKPRTAVFTLWLDDSGGAVDPWVSVLGDWDVKQADQAVSDPSKLKELRRKMLEREEGSGGRESGMSLSDPSMLKLLLEELDFWTKRIGPSAGGGGPEP